MSTASDEVKRWVRQHAPTDAAAHSRFESYADVAHARVSCVCCPVQIHHCGVLNSQFLHGTGERELRLYRNGLLMASRADISIDFLESATFNQVRPHARADE